MEEVHSAAEPIGYSDSPFTISQPPDITNWFSSYVYESLALSSSGKDDGEREPNGFSVREEDKYILGADKDHKPMNKNIQETNNLYESPLLSEPPDIGNWFSSYAYESPPVLDTNDALCFSVGGEDSECVKETQAEEETKDIEGKDDVCPSLFEQQLVSSSAKVADFSQSQHLLSEPPDVGNWFSSYVYESPQLSDTHEIEVCSSEKYDQLIIEESDTEGENSSGIFRKTKSKQETIIAPGWLKSNDCTEAKEVSAYSNQEREKKSTVILFNASTKKEDKDSSFKQEPLFSETKEEANFIPKGYNPKPQSLQELRPKHIQETISNRQMSPRKAAQKARPEENMESVNQESDDKENVDAETGFVTMKKARFRESRDQSSMKKPIRGVLGECSRSKKLKKMATEEDEERKKKKKKRRILGEMWNHQLSGGEEIAGKWSCPQRKKGKSGPPLKQLRLDAWPVIFNLTGLKIKTLESETVKMSFVKYLRRDSLLQLAGKQSLSRSFMLQTCRTLIIETALPESVKLNRLSGSDSGIVEVNLDRPVAKNSINKEMLKGLQNTFETIHQDSSARVVMITSLVPGVFCAGADLKERRTMSPSEVHTYVNSLRYMFSFIEALSIPTIAAIEGVALGGGLEMALSCDLRICGENAVFGLPETGLAVIPGAGGTQRLSRLVGRSVSKELIFTGRKIDAREAAKKGLVNFCVAAGEAHKKAMEVAQQINEKGPMAIKMAKKAIDEGIETNMASGLELEDMCYQKLLNTEDRLEGLAAFAEKRKPRYTGK
uniref:Uncharacterized protein n=1 Tax=Brassica campestris TaxID=3711 RepID=M4DX33_BRACM